MGFFFSFSRKMGWRIAMRGLEDHRGCGKRKLMLMFGCRENEEERQVPTAPS